jgi:serine protease Do
MTVLTIMVAGPSLSRQIAHAHKTEEIRLIQQSLENSSTLAQLSQAFRDVASTVEPSVVSIQVLQRTKTVRNQGNGGALPMSPEDFMDRFFDMNPHGRSPRQQDTPKPDENSEDYDQYNPLRPYGSGSGWVYSKDGFIITNNHVVTKQDGKSPADEIKVKFHDGRERIATIVGTDPKTDIAVIKVEGPVIPAKLATQETIAQGDMVFAFGSPFGIEFSMSQGIISATNRRNLQIIGGDGFEDFIQTDAAINPGNSGGPLTNIYGHVVGMNTAIASRTGAFNGIGFAIPITMVASIADQIIETGHVERGFLGIGIQDLEPKLAKSFGLEGQGVLITKPIEGSPAEKAGLQANDIITEVQGRKVKTADALKNFVASHKPGQTLKVKVFRGGKFMDFDVTIAKRPENTAINSMNDIEENQPQGDIVEKPLDKGVEALKKLGIEEAETWTEEMAKRVEVEYAPGVVIKTVRPGSEAQRQGLRAGTVITHIMSAENNAISLKVTDIKMLSEEIAKHNLTKGVRMHVSQPTRIGMVDRIIFLELPDLE